MSNRTDNQKLGLSSNPQFVCREGHSITPDGALKIRKMEKEIERLTAELASARELIAHAIGG